MKRLLIIAALLLMAVQNEPVPTLVPPTLVPTPDQGVNDVRITESAVARIQRDGKVRVGILYNEVPFGLLNVRGLVAGFDADLARSMADAWGVDVEFVQVTRQTAFATLREGTVDMLAAAIVHRRDSDSQVEFSRSYYRGSQSVMLRNDDPATSPAGLAERKLGFVMGTASETAIANWQARSGIHVVTQPYLTLDQGLAALAGGEIDGLVGSRFALNRLLQPGVLRLLDEGLAPQPYAIAVRRQDVNFRDLVDRTLQYLVNKGRLNEIYDSNLPGLSYPTGLIQVWDDLGDDAPKPDQYGTEIAYPTFNVVPRLQGGQALRVAGLRDVAADAPESERRLNDLNRAMIEQMTSRWGVQVTYIPNSADNALDLLANGDADLAVGVSPLWAWTDRVDFTAPYLLHGDRLLVKKNSDIESFNELRGGRWVGIFASEPGSADKVNALAESINTAVNIYTMIREQDVPFYILEDNNADVAFGDSLKLIPQVQSRPDDFRLAARCAGCDPWYSREYVTMAVPRNDIDFRLLVEYTLQEMAQDGTLNSLLQPVMLPDEFIKVDVWPGQPEYLGYTLR